MPPPRNADTPMAGADQAATSAHATGGHVIACPRVIADVADKVLAAGKSLVLQLEGVRQKGVAQAGR